MFTFKYGLDAPKVIRNCLLGSITFILLGIASLLYLYTIPSILHWLITTSLFMTALGCVYPAIMITIGSLFLKFRERDWLISKLKIKSDESVLDVGCGRGLLLTAIAKKLTSGKIIGIDIWDNNDQANNNAKNTLNNIESENIANKASVLTADARSMPFKDASFDIVVSSWALHNIPTPQEREKALSEIMRVAKPNGTIAIMDIECYLEYIEFFKNKNIKDISVFGPRYTFGNATYMIVLKKHL